MLVITRQLDQVVVITLPDGREMRVTVTDIKGGKIRLGFDAATDVLIDREEVHQQKKHRAAEALAKAEAAGVAP